MARQGCAVLPTYFTQSSTLQLHTDLPANNRRACISCWILRAFLEHVFSCRPHRYLDCELSPTTISQPRILREDIIFMCILDCFLTSSTTISHDDWVWPAQQQLKHVYTALATATQFASFVLELIVGIWSRFDVFVPIDMINVMCRCQFMCKESWVVFAARWQLLWAYGQGSTFSSLCNRQYVMDICVCVCKANCVAFIPSDMFMFRHFCAYWYVNMSLIIHVHLYSRCSFLLLPIFLQGFSWVFKESAKFSRIQLSSQGFS